MAVFVPAFIQAAREIPRRGRAAVLIDELGILGLRAIAKGMNGLVKNDQEMADKMMLVFDAVHSYCSRRTSGHRAWATEEPGWGG